MACAFFKDVKNFFDDFGFWAKPSAEDCDLLSCDSGCRQGKYSCACVKCGFLLFLLCDALRRVCGISQYCQPKRFEWVQSYDFNAYINVFSVFIQRICNSSTNKCVDHSSYGAHKI